jgi:serine/threonine protein kinase
MEIPNYAIERELGKGGMATVYLARQIMLNRQVALKVMSPEFSTGKAFQEAFLHEGKIVAQLEHPNIVKVYDIGIVNGSTFYMAMEYLSGGSLRDRLKTEAFTPAAVLQILRQLGAGLEYAHQQGFIHRDIKPENILFRKDGTAILTDFGIAKVQDSTGDMTRMGLTAGTAQYMSPEQAMVGKLDYRSDLYSLGLVVFEMLSGDKVCKADSFAQAVYQHTTQPPPALPVAYRVFQPVMQKVLAKQPEQRYGNVNEFVEAFALALKTLQTQQQQAEPPSTAAVSAGDTAIFIPEQPAATRLFASALAPPSPIPLAASSHAAETSPVLTIREQTSWWQQPLFITSLVGGMVAGLVALLLLPLFQPESATTLPEPPVIPSSPPALPTPPTSTDNLTPVNPVSVTSGRQEAGIKGRQFVVQTTDGSLLILRSKPGRDSKEVAKLPVGTIVSVLGNTVYDETIARKKGKWLYVSALGKQGYVFDVHLQAHQSVTANGLDFATLNYDAAEKLDFKGGTYAPLQNSLSGDKQSHVYRLRIDITKGKAITVAPLPGKVHQGIAVTVVFGRGKALLGSGKAEYHGLDGKVSGDYYIVIYRIDNASTPLEYGYYVEVPPVVKTMPGQ